MSANPTYWKMRNGESISIDDMDCHHVKNVLKMIVNNSNNHKRTKKLMEISAEKSFDDIQLNGDMANEFNDSHLSDEDDDEKL